jgi:hypothetical protein
LKKVLTNKTKCAIIKVQKRDTKEVIKMMYGNSSMGYSYSPDRRNDRVDHSNLRSQFLGASGSRQGGYYYSPTSYSTPKPTTTGWYDGAGRYHEK